MKSPLGILSNLTWMINRLSHYLGLVRFAHTVFALPFAFTAAIVAANGVPPWREAWWILFCMVTARTSAMTFNRIVDRYYDQLNERTRMRHIPAGIVSVTEAYVVWVIVSGSFIFGAYCLNFLAFILSPIALIVICGYSYVKRFSSLSHIVLGLSLGIAPIGAWIGIEGTLGLPSLLLAAGVLMWVAGFDIIYALMDEEFDKKHGLHSLVVRFGSKNALRIAFCFHLLCTLFFALFGWYSGLGTIYYCAVIMVILLIIYQHQLVRPDDHSRLNIAFFNINAIISLGLFFFTCIDLWFQ